MLRRLLSSIFWVLKNWSKEIDWSCHFMMLYMKYIDDIHPLGGNDHDCSRIAKELLCGMIDVCSFLNTDIAKLIHAYSPSILTCLTSGKGASRPPRSMNPSWSSHDPTSSLEFSSHFSNPGIKYAMIHVGLRHTPRGAQGSCTNNSTESPGFETPRMAGRPRADGSDSSEV